MCMLVVCAGPQVNAQKLPEVDPSLGYGLRLADEKHLLIQPNWRLDVTKRDRQDGPGAGRH